MKPLPLKQSSRLALLVCLASLSLFCAEKQPAEVQINNKIQHAKSAIENLDIKDLNKVLSNDFEATGDRKNYDHDTIKKMMALYAFRKQKVSLVISPPIIQLDNHNTHLATSDMTVLITAGRSLIPDDGRVYKVTGTWRLFNNEWLLTRLSWQ